MDDTCSPRNSGHRGLGLRQYRYLRVYFLSNTRQYKGRLPTIVMRITAGIYAHKDLTMPPENHAVDIALLKKELEQMRTDVGEIKNSVETLVDAWKAAGVLVSAVKMAAAIVLSLGVIIGALKFGFNPQSPE